jgi:hypothetical protein
MFYLDTLASHLNLKYCVQSLVQKNLLEVIANIHLLFVFTISPT